MSVYCCSSPVAPRSRSSIRGGGRRLAWEQSSHSVPPPTRSYTPRLTLAERNYDVGNRELLAVVLVLQEWRHWLEGSTHTFVVWTDHKNLSYLHSTQIPNSRQAWWALFLGLFNFILTYRPGSRNVIPNPVLPLHPPSGEVL